MAIDWKKSMQQTYEFYEVDPGTWKNRRLNTSITGCGISRDLSAETRGSATIDCTGEIGETYIRAYMTPIQNGSKYNVPLATFLVQTPSENFDGKVKTMSLDAYTPLLELKDDKPPLGFTILAGTNIMKTAVTLCREHMRAPVVEPSEDSTTLHDDFVANTDDTWLSFLSAFIAIAKYSFDLDEMGRVLFSPYQDTASLQPVWTYDDSNSSILYPEIQVERDLYGIPNVVEVIFSTNSSYLYSKVVNKDINSPISTLNRGREIIYRDTNPGLAGNPTQEMVDEYADQLLRNLSTLEYMISYTHGYSPARIGDCVRLNYTRAGLNDIKVKVISQSFNCETGCSVTETAIYTNKLWG